MAESEPERTPAEKFLLLWQENLPELSRYVKRYSFGAYFSYADDILQDVFEYIWKKINSGELVDINIGYLSKAAKHKLIQQERRKYVRNRGITRYLLNGMIVAVLDERKLDYKMLYDYLDNRLTHKQKERVIWWSRGYSYAEVAKIMGEQYTSHWKLKMIGVMKRLRCHRIEIEELGQSRKGVERKGIRWRGRTRNKQLFNFSLGGYVHPNIYEYLGGKD